MSGPCLVGTAANVAAMPAECIWYCDPSSLSPDSASWLPVTDEAGVEICAVWSARRCYPTPSGVLDVQVFAAEEMELPLAGDAEPVVGILARVQQLCQSSRGQLCVHGARHCFSAAQLHVLEHIRFFGIADEEDQQWWDELLGRGQLCFAICGRLRVAVQSVRRNAGTWLLGLNCGLFACEVGTAVTHLHEERHQTRWQWADAQASTAVIVRGGYEAARLGASGTWSDNGSEGYVRLVARAPGGGQVLTQPRMVLGAAHGQ